MAKHRTKRTKRHEDESLQELVGDWRFTDPTINEADGEYEECKKIMESEPSPWALGTDVTLIHDFGMANFHLEMFDDGKVRITKFATSMKDHVANFDLRFLNSWCYKNGWQKPEVNRYVVLENQEFWKHMWEVNSIECPYLETRYGKRPGEETGSERQ